MIYLGIGSNLGDRLKNIYKAYELITYIGEIKDKSPIYESPPLKTSNYKKKQPDYLNSVISIATDLSPHILLFELKNIEKAVGHRSDEKWGPRYMDIDILLYNDLLLKNSDLIIPHKEMAKRNFVLKPLLDISGDIKLPNTNEKISDLLKKLENEKLTLFKDK